MSGGPGNAVATVAEVTGRQPAVSRFRKEILEEHRRYFGGRDRFRHEEAREPLVPPVGPTIREPGLAERWARYDADYRGTDRISRFWVCEVEGATVFPPLGLVAVGDTVLRETIRNAEQLRTLFPGTPTEALRAAMTSRAERIAGGLPAPARHVPGTSFLLGFGVFGNYYNWVLRYASRVALYQACGARVPLIVPARSKAYVADTLAFLGVPEEDCVFLDAPMSFERLVLVSPVAFGRYELSPLITLTLREHPRVRALPRGAKRRLYVPRRDVKIRPVVNEAEVEAALAAEGFVSFDGAAHPVEEQVRAFRDASLVVAPHGAGLSNIVFCDPGTPVVEAVPEGYDQGATSYRSFADLFGLRYRQVFGREATPDRKGNRCNAGIALDVEELRAVIGEVAGAGG